MNWLIGSNFLKSYLHIRFFVCLWDCFLSRGGGEASFFFRVVCVEVSNWTASKNVQRDFYLKESSRKPVLMWTIIAHKFLSLISWFFMYLFWQKANYTAPKDFGFGKLLSPFYFSLEVILLPQVSLISQIVTCVTFNFFSSLRKWKHREMLPLEWRACLKLQCSKQCPK